MNPNQFQVLEHGSYDMIGVWFYETFRNPLRNKESKTRMLEAIIDTVEPLNCELRLFPDYEFIAAEFAER